jgi:hypothetical protein
MQSRDERLALLQMDIAILRDQLDHVAEQPHLDIARQFLRRELLASQQMYLALLKNRHRRLAVQAVGE